MMDMAGPSPLLVLLRGGHVAGMVSALGALAFRRWMLPAADAPLRSRILRKFPQLCWLNLLLFNCR